MNDDADPDDAVLRIAEAQHSLITDRQALDVGMTRRMWAHRVTRGDWDRVTRRVVRRRGAAPSDGQRALAAVLDAGPHAYLSHHAGVAHWGYPGFRREPFAVISLRDRKRPSELAFIHRPLHLPDPFATVVDGVPVVRPALLLLQMAPLVHPEKLNRLTAAGFTMIRLTEFQIWHRKHEVAAIVQKARWELLRRRAA